MRNCSQEHKMMLTILLGSISIIFLFHCYLKYGRVGRLLSLIPGPKGYPIIGNVHHYYVDNEILLKKFWKLNDDYYPIQKVWFLMYYAVILLDPDDIQVLLTSNTCIKKGIFYKHLQHWLSTGLLTSDGQKWHLRRKMLTPAFHFNVLKHYFTNLIEESQNLVECLKQEGNKKKHSLLDLLIAASWNDNQIDEEGIREEVDTFMFGGHDTTASALTFTLSLFAKLKDVQENIRDEVKTIMQEGNNITIASLKKLSYLERCLKESFRLYPSVHIISRQIPHDMQLKQYLIPSGTICLIDIHNVHRNPEYWPNPNVFDPDRFLPENIKERHPYSYIPFSAGPRNCIGQKFAMLELKLFVAFILYNFELEPVDELDDVTFISDITLNTSKPLRVKFIPI
ncbi:PREDICTED: cytochrome P450 4C1-like [Polistes dominula]|uniref:Cytochrome P450 4C1-like n=1 Tax=Polistes dominula TaxID=743375 RepID=A0ABM1IGG9_POLDO|nr:PREDICTED: cytochrome P450 4C1-like [Polistes dominula]